MMRRSERILENIPVGALGLIPVTGCEELGAKVNDYLVQWRKESSHQYQDDVAFTGYLRDDYIIGAKVPRFGSGEAKGIITDSVRGKDLYLMVDVLNYSVTYSLTGNINHMSPDDHFQNLKRVIAAIGGKSRRTSKSKKTKQEGRGTIFTAPPRTAPRWVSGCESRREAISSPGDGRGKRNY